MSIAPRQRTSSIAASRLSRPSRACERQMTEPEKGISLLHIVILCAENVVGLYIVSGEAGCVGEQL